LTTIEPKKVPDPSAVNGYPLALRAFSGPWAGDFVFSDCSLLALIAEMDMIGATGQKDMTSSGTVGSQ